MGSILDNQGYMEKRDPDGVISSIARFPVDARRAIEDADRLDLKAIRRKYNGLVVAGMGGSAGGGALSCASARAVSGAAARAPGSCPCSSILRGTSRGRPSRTSSSAWPRCHE